MASPMAARFAAPRGESSGCRSRNRMSSPISAMDVTRQCQTRPRWVMWPMGRPTYAATERATAMRRRVVVAHRERHDRDRPPHTTDEGQAAVPVEDARDGVRWHEDVRTTGDVPGREILEGARNRWQVTHAATAAGRVNPASARASRRASPSSSPMLGELAGEPFDDQRVLGHELLGPAPRSGELGLEITADRRDQPSAAGSGRAGRCRWAGPAGRDRPRRAAARSRWRRACRAGTRRRRRRGSPARRRGRRR